MEIKTNEHYQLADTILKLNRLAKDYMQAHLDLDPNNAKVTALGEELEAMSLKFAQLLEEVSNEN